MPTPSPVHAGLAAAFADAFGHAPEGVWRAPGRVNLIGEHTDYNEGLVLPFALPLGVSAAASRRDDGLVEVRSLQADTAVTASVSGTPGDVEGWAAYPVGMARVLHEHGPDGHGRKVGGATLLFDSDLPQGAGLSSSAALECATAIALCDLHGVEIAPAELARLAQRAENEHVGVPSGIMDQSASMLSSAGSALLLDCRTGLTSDVPFAPQDAGLTLMVIDTRATHELTGGEYGQRRAECERAAEILGVPALRDIKDLPAALAQLDEPVLRRRVQHVVTENHRVEATVGLLRAGAVAEIGGLLLASHMSLRDQFEISWPEANVAVDEAVRAGARGGRMVGGGFGGSVIVLTHTERADRVRDAINAAYESRSWTPPVFLTDTAPSQGARRLS